MLAKNWIDIVFRRCAWAHLMTRRYPLLQNLQYIVSFNFNGDAIQYILTVKMPVKRVQKDSPVNLSYIDAYSAAVWSIISWGRAGIGGSSLPSSRAAYNSLW